MKVIPKAIMGLVARFNISKNIAKRVFVLNEIIANPRKVVLNVLRNRKRRAIAAAKQKSKDIGSGLLDILKGAALLAIGTNIEDIKKFALNMTLDDNLKDPVQFPDVELPAEELKEADEHVSALAEEPKDAQYIEQPNAQELQHLKQAQEDEDLKPRMGEIESNIDRIEFANEQENVNIIPPELDIAPAQKPNLTTVSRYQQSFPAPTKPQQSTKSDVQLEMPVASQPAQKIPSQTFSDVFAPELPVYKMNKPTNMSAPEKQSNITHVSSPGKGMALSQENQNERRRITLKKTEADDYGSVDLHVQEPRVRTPLRASSDLYGSR